MKIKDAKPKGDIKESGYYQVFQDEEIAKVIQLVQSTCISNGTELERIIFSKVKCDKYESKKKFKLTFDIFIDIIKNATSNVYFKSISIDKDFFIKNGIKFSGKNKMILDSAFYFYETKTLYLGEIKNGMGLDTKKSEKEVDSLSTFKDLCLIYLDGVEIYPFMVLFNCNDLSHSSIKTNRTDFIKYTGEKYCELVKVSHDEIKSITLEDAKDNREFFHKKIIQTTPDKILLEEVKKRGLI